MNKAIIDSKLVPILVFHNVSEVVPTVSLFAKGNIKAVEVCFRTECALEALKLTVEKFKDILVGAGTVINAKQAEEAIGAGAAFIVGPGLSEEVAKVCKKHNVIYVPGVFTASEIMKALDLGLDYLKIFPAGELGIKYIASLAAAFPHVKFMPSGGVTLDNLKDYVSKPFIFAVSGSFINKGDIYKNALLANKIVSESRK